MTAMIRLATDKLTCMYGKFTAVKSATLEFGGNPVDAVIVKGELVHGALSD